MRKEHTKNAVDEIRCPSELRRVRLMLRKFSLVIAGLLAVTAPVLAHHAFSAEFDSSKAVKLQGPVTKIELVNPHAWIHMSVKKADGSNEEWMVEGGTPNTLQRRGITRDSIKVGTVIIVEGFQAKDGTLKANGRNLTFTDGRTL